VGRTPSAVSDTGDGGGDLGSASSLGVVVRLSPDARKILAQHDDERAGRAAADGGAPDTSRAPASADAGATLGTASSADAPAATGGGGQAGDDKTAGDKTAAGQTAGKAGATDKGRHGGLETLTPEQQDVVSKLSARDTAVRAHEAAHQAAAGGLGGAASFSYETGPDGKRYAVGGEVPVSLRPGRTPQETIANAQTVRSAALAPADPSAQDLAVAAQASQMEAQARQEITQNGAAGKQDATTGGAPPRTRRSTGSDRQVGASQKGEPRSVTAGDNLESDRAGSEADAIGQASSNAVQPIQQSIDDGRDRDPLMVFSTLKSERSSPSGAFYGHLHSSGDGCAICARAAARYA
jgi:hypothetical protein